MNQMPQVQTKNNLKLLLIILVIVIIGASVFYYFYIMKGSTSSTATISPTATVKTSPSVKSSVSPSASPSIPTDWKTYTDSQYGYTIKYPPTVTEENINNNAIFQNLLTITVSGVHNQSLDAYIQDMVKNIQVKDPQKITLLGQPAYEGIGLGLANTYEVYFIKGNNFYQLTFKTNNKDTLTELKTGLSEIQKQMLSTFQFTQ